VLIRFIAKVAVHLSVISLYKHGYTNEVLVAFIIGTMKLHYIIFNLKKLRAVRWRNTHYSFYCIFYSILYVLFT